VASPNQPRESKEEKVSSRMPDLVSDAYADPLSQPRPASCPGENDDRELFSSGKEGELEWVLVPVTHRDHERRRRRVKLVGISILLALAALAAWYYKLKTDPIRALEAYDAGERSLRSARYSQAILSFNRALALKPDLADAYLMRGRANVAQGRQLEAIPDFNKVIELRPRDPIAFLERGGAYLDVKDIPEAFADFTRAQELDPKLDTAYNRRALAYRAMGQPEKALDELNRAVALRANTDNIFQRGAINAQLGNHAAAVEDFTQLINAYPSSAQAYFARAQSYRALGDTVNAERDQEAGRILDGR
jgi:tetratricopeptide (TPR) repeat protein